MRRRLTPSIVVALLTAANVIAGASRCASGPRTDPQVAAERVRSAVTSGQSQAEVRAVVGEPDFVSDIRPPGVPQITTPAPAAEGDLRFWYWGSRTDPVAWVALYKGTVVSKSP